MTDIDFQEAVRHGVDAHLDIADHALGNGLTFSRVEIDHDRSLGVDLAVRVPYDEVSRWAESLGGIPWHDHSTPDGHLQMRVSRAFTGAALNGQRGQWLVRVAGERVVQLAPVDDHPAPSYITHQQRHDRHQQPRRPA